MGMRSRQLIMGEFDENTILNSGEIVWDPDTKRLVVGDGVNSVKDLEDIGGYVGALRVGDESEVGDGKVLAFSEETGKLEYINVESATPAPPVDLTPINTSLGEIQADLLTIKDVLSIEVVLDKSTAIAGDNTNKTVLEANRDAVTLTQENNAVTITGNLTALQECTIGTTEGKWLGITVSTGENMVFYMSIDGVPISEDNLINGIGALEPDEFVFWLNIDDIATDPKSIIFGKKGRFPVTIVISFVNTAT